MVCAFTILALFIIIILPLAGILSGTSLATLKSAVVDQEIIEAVRESLLIAFFVVMITLPLSFLCAFCVTHTNIRFKQTFSVLCTLPLFLPPISFGFGLLALLGKNGLLYLFSGIRVPLLGRLGIVLGQILYTFPFSFLLLRDSMQKADMAVYENSILLQISTCQYLFDILIPKFKKTIVTVFFSIIMMSLGEYSICLILGGKIKVLALLIYRQIYGGLDFSAGIILEFILFIPFLTLLIIDIVYHEVESGTMQKGCRVPENRKVNIFAYCLLTSVSLLILSIFLILAVMCFSKNYPVDISFSWSHIIRALSVPYCTFYVNSIVIALLVSLLGCVLCVAASYYASRGGQIKRRLFYVVSAIPRIAPGLLFGIGYMTLYKGNILHDTYTIIILANIAYFFSTPFFLAYHSLCYMDPRYEDIAYLYEIPRKRMFVDVYLPYMRNTILDMFFFFFSNSMITISAVVFLYTSRTMPYALLLNYFEGSMEYFSRSAAVSLIILLTNLLVFIITTFLKYRRK